jgi:hypothetical protein
LSKSLKTSRPTAVFLFVGFLVAYLPFLQAGYGKEFDAWSNALNARIIAQTGVYEVSRLPGHPLYELLLSGLYPLNHSYFLFNFLSAMASAACVGLLYKIACFYKVKNALWLSLTFGLIPVFFIAGTYTIDYNFALCFLLFSWWFGLQKKTLAAGLFIALAAGWRISSLGFLLPYALLFAPYFKIKDYIKFTTAAAFGSVLAFSAPLYTYGLDFLNFHKPPFPGWANVAYKLSFGVWGLPLLLGICLAIVLIFWRRQKRSNVATAVLPRFFGWALALALGMQLAVFLRLPFKSEFFIPALPFLVLAVFIWLKPIEAKALTALALLSLLTFGFDYHQPWRGAPPSNLAITFKAGGHTIYLDPAQGPLFVDQGKRHQKAATVEKAIIALKEKSQPAYVVAGWYWPHLVFKYTNTNHHFEHYATKAEIARAKTNGYAIYYLPEMAKQNQIVEGYYLHDSIAKPLLKP